MEEMLEKLEGVVRKNCLDLNHQYVDVGVLLRKVEEALPYTITEDELYTLAAETAAYLSTIHPDYSLLAARIVIAKLHEKTHNDFVSAMTELYEYRSEHTGEAHPLVNEDFYNFAVANRDRINQEIKYDRDLQFDYFGYKTLERSYLLKTNKRIVERPQHMYMRVALAIHIGDIDQAIKVYHEMSGRFYTHATPTLFNAGTRKQQMSSCFLLTTKEDSIDGIYDTLRQCALISQNAGGIGLAIHNVRAKGSFVRGTNGTSNGIIPMLRVFNDTAQYVDQCFAGDTIVYTKDGPKRIEDITVGDEVISDDGKFNRVSKVLVENKSENVMSIRLRHTVKPVIVTKEHQIKALNDQKYMINRDVVINRLEKNISHFNWTDAQHLNEESFLYFPIPDYSQDAPVTNDDMRFYGMMLGDGWIVKNTGQLGISCNPDTDDTDFILQYLKSRSIHVTVDDRRLLDKSNRNSANNIRYVWSANMNFPFTYVDLYNEKGEKRIHRNYLHLPQEKTLSLIKGLMDSDGHVGVKENSFENTSYELIEGLRYLSMRLGVLTSGYHRDYRVGTEYHLEQRSFTSQKESSVLKIPRTEVMASALECDVDGHFMYTQYKNMLMSRIKDVQEIHYEGPMYDLVVENNPSYTTHFGVVHNGGGKRKGAFCIYLEPWHQEIFEFLDLKKNHGKEELRARHLFYALWINDLFMKRVETDGDWSLFDPNRVPGLPDTWGAEFEELYIRYEQEGRAHKTIKARDLWMNIITSQIETGTPFMLYKDSANAKSNQQNLGTIRSSNLCVTYDSKILTDNGYMDFDEIHNGKTIDQQAEVVINAVNSKGIFPATEVVRTSDLEDVFEVELENGLKIKSTNYHKYMRGDELVELHEISVGDKIKFFDGSKSTFGKIDDPDYGLLAGLVIGDGSLSRSRDSQRAHVRLYGRDIEEFGDILTSKLKNIWNQEEKSQYVTGANHEPDFNGSTKQPKGFEYTRKEYTSIVLGNKLREDGVSIGDKHKIPKSIWKSNKETVASFLRGLFSADAYAGYYQGAACYVRLCSINEKMLQDIQLLLLQFGINSSVFNRAEGQIIERNDGKGGTKEYYHKPKYELSISKRSNLEKFHEMIGFVQSYKNEKITSYLANCKGSQNSMESYQSKVKSITFIGSEPVYCVKESIHNEVCLNGMITSNCTEILQYTSPEEVAVCNLASIALPMFVKADGSYDFDSLHTLAKQVVVNLNKVIDLNYYPVPEARNSNMKHRPVGLGVQGLADVFIKMRLPFDSVEARQLNKDIFETLYHASVESSMEIAEKEGSYESFPGSPMSRGIFQFDMWRVEPSNRYNWEELRLKVIEKGVRNSLLLAPMPTASTSQILGNNECIEPITSNVYSRRVLAGEFPVINKHLVDDLIKLGLWNNKIKDKIISNNGSIQGLTEIPDDLKAIYKTVWEIKQRAIVEMAADRGAFICQSQSLNIHMEDVNHAKLSSLHFTAWKLGLKTGMYYLRTKAAVEAVRFTIREDVVIDEAKAEANKNMSDIVCSLDNPEACEACGS